MGLPLSQGERSAVQAMICNDITFAFCSRMQYLFNITK